MIGCSWLFPWSRLVGVRRVDLMLVSGKSHWEDCEDWVGSGRPVKFPLRDIKNSDLCTVAIFPMRSWQSSVVLYI